RPVPIAIVGMSCRLPGSVSTPGEFYRLLCRKKSGWAEVPPDRFNINAYHHPNPHKKGCFNSQGGYFLNTDINSFDAGFFDITRKEAESMDPAQRLLLECSYEALENAGMPKESVSGRKVGVFIGGNYSEHRVANLRDLDNVPSFDPTGNQGAFLAGRVAYYFNLQGPTFTVDTACSSSMHALHLAVQSIRAGESEQAIVGASHLITDPDIWVSMGQLRLFSDAGKTYAFDHRAKSGYARGEGAGCLILKPLDQARGDNDHIYSVITHTGISHNGRTVGIVAPCPDQQESLLNKVFYEARINPCDVGFFEAHGTGTRKGDPIEATSIYKAVGRHFTPEDPLYIGSVKPNVGHLECASGLISVIKGALMLYYGFILPNADFERVNEAIPLERWNMRVATNQKPWPAKRKYLCVNNFGFSGSNSTCILSAAPRLRGIEVADNGAYSPLRLFVLSANDEEALRNSVKRLGIWIEQHAELYQTTMPRNLAYTLCQRRSHLPWRVSVVAGMCSEVAKAINSHDTSPARAPSERPRVAFVYTGQGAQWHAMGRELLRTHPRFLESIQRADSTLRMFKADFSILEELTRDKESSRVGLPHISQPICTAVQLALTDLLSSFGVRPGAVTGHSSGEIAAAYAVGALSFQSAMTAAYKRGQMIIELQATQPQLRGAMLAVGTSAKILGPLLDAFNEDRPLRVVVACENSPSSTTLSGDEDVIDKMAELLNRQGFFARRLLVDVAYHSPHMKLIAESYLDSIRGTIQEPAWWQYPKVQFFSSLRGRRINLYELGPQYWVDNLTQAVHFSTSLRQLCTEYSPDILLEIGPHAALKGPIMQGIKALGPLATKISYLPTLLRDQNATRTCLETAGQLFVRGYPLKFFAINHHREEIEKPELLATLYTYPWSRQSYQHDTRITRQHREKPFRRNDLLGTLADWSSDLDPTWRNIIRTEDLPWLKEYRIGSRMAFPVAGFISMVIQAAAQMAIVYDLHVAGFEIENLRISEHLFLAEGVDVEVLLNFRASESGNKSSHTFKLTSHHDGRDWLEHCAGTVTVMSSMSTSRDAIESEMEEGESEVLSFSESSCSSTFSTASSDSSLMDYQKGGKGQAKRWTPDSSDRSGQFGQGADSLLGGADAYGRLASSGISYPSSFQTLFEATVKGARVSGQHTIQDMTSQMPLEHETPYDLHPVTVDAMLQTPLFGLKDTDDGSIVAPCLPSSIRRMTIRSDWTPMAGDIMFVSAEPEQRTASFMVELYNLWDNPLISMSGLKFKSLEHAPKDTTAPRELCYKVNWEPFDETAAEIPFEVSNVRNGAAILIVTTNHKAVTDFYVRNLVCQLRQRAHVPVTSCAFDAVPDWSNNFVIVLDWPTPVLLYASTTELEGVQKLLTQTCGLMWVTNGATRFPHHPGGGLALGLIRTARSERGAVASTFDLDPFSAYSPYSTVDLMVGAFISSVLLHNKEGDMEFAEEDFELVVPRIIPDAELNREVHRSLGQAGPYVQDFHQPDRQLQLARRVYGATEDVYFEDAPETVLADDEVEIAVDTTVLSQDDVPVGTEDEPSTRIPRSCAGTVTRIGGAVSTICVGHRVCALAEGPFGTHARAKWTSVASIPDTISPVDAAVIAGPILAAFYALVKVALLQYGERVLVQLSGPAGVAALSLSLEGALRVTMYALVMDERQEALARKIGLPSDRIIDGRSIYRSRKLEEATGGRGVDVVLTMSGCETAIAWECLASCGRLVEIKTSSAHETARPEIGANMSFSSVDMLSLAAESPQTMRMVLDSLLFCISEGYIVRPMAFGIIRTSGVSAGLQVVQDGYVGAVVAMVKDGEERVKALHRVPKSIFRSDGTHLIVGTGGLARSLAKYMMDHGARTVVLLSRTGGGDVVRQQLEREAQDNDAQAIAMKCDVTDQYQVRELMEDCQRDLPPVCGVIHAAMVLRDDLLENITAEDYYKVIGPKVYGAINLDEILDSLHIELDYFVVLSSAAGIIGSRGQGAYAAANTFLDSLMRYRVQRGMPGTSLDLTVVTGAGYLAENAERQEEIVRNFGNETINEDEVLALVSAAVRGIGPPQCLTGLKLHLGSDGQWPYYANDGRFAHLKAECLAVAEKEGLVPKQAVSPGTAFRAAGSDEEAVQIAAQGIVQKLSEVLSIAVENLDAARNITSYGLDSLTAIELRNWIAKELHANLQILELLSSGTLNDLAALIVQKTK
ncbi:polyketide synthase, partial [Chaetomium sp. MPI-CAGE-AT-0009]